MESLVWFWHTLATRKRVITALMLRDVYSRYGRDSLGVGWIVFEPLVFIFPVLTMWSYIRGTTEHGVDVLSLCWSGYMPLMLYRHMVGYQINILRTEGLLFHHQPIAVLDFMTARILIETLSNAAAAIVSWVALVIVNVLYVPRDLPMFYLGWGFMIWWCASLSLIIAAFSIRTIWVEKVWMVAGYMYIAVSGCFYMANWLPESARRWALFQPSLQSYEMIRRGVFGEGVRTYFDVQYEVIVLTVLTFIGLLGISQARRYLVSE